VLFSEKLPQRSIACSSSSSSSVVLTISYDCSCREKDNEHESSPLSMGFVIRLASAFRVILNQRDRIARTKTTNRIFSNSSVRVLHSLNLSGHSSCDQKDPLLIPINQTGKINCLFSSSFSRFRQLPSFKDPIPILR